MIKITITTIRIFSSCCYHYYFQYHYYHITHLCPFIQGDLDGWSKLSMNSPCCAICALMEDWVLFKHSPNETEQAKINSVPAQGQIDHKHINKLLVPLFIYDNYSRKWRIRGQRQSIYVVTTRQGVYLLSASIQQQIYIHLIHPVTGLAGQVPSINCQGHFSYLMSNDQKEKSFQVFSVLKQIRLGKTNLAQ